MYIISVIIYLLQMYFIVGGIVTIGGILATARDQLNRKPDKDHMGHDLAILLPVYHEQDIICDTIDYFARIVPHRKNNKILIICTEREDCLQDASCKTTFAVAYEYILRKQLEDRIELLKAPDSYVGKVGQMNYAVKWLHQNALFPEYVGVYDADSRPDPNVFRDIDRELTDREVRGVRFPEILQQVSCYCSAAEHLSGFAGALALADAFSQTKWAIGFEYPLFKVYCAQIHRKKARPLVYCIGHGCFVNFRYLEQIKGFPEYNKNDDLSLGYLASTLESEVFPLPSLDYCQISPEQKTTVSQYRSWYSGSARYFQDIEHYSRIFNIQLPKYQKAIFFLQGALRNFFWAWRGVIWIFCLLLALISCDLSLLLTVIAGLLLYVTIPLTLTVCFFYRLGTLKAKRAVSFFALVLAPINFIMRGIGPCIAVLTQNKGGHPSRKAKRIIK